MPGLSLDYEVIRLLLLAKFHEAEGVCVSGLESIENVCTNKCHICYVCFLGKAAKSNRTRLQKTACGVICNTSTF